MDGEIRKGMYDRIEMKTMTEEEDFIRIAAVAAKQYCLSRMVLGNIEQTECIDAAIKAFKLRYRAMNGIWNNPMNPKDIMKFNEMYRRIKGRIIEEAKNTALKYSAQYKARSVKKTAARAIIDSAFEEAGLEIDYTDYQCHRAKVHLLLPHNYKLMVIVKYNDVLKGKVGDYVRQVLLLAKDLEQLSVEIHIWK